MPSILQCFRRSRLAIRLGDLEQLRQAAAAQLHERERPRFERWFNRYCGVPAEMQALRWAVDTKNRAQAH
jgi:hypothetical protein